MDALSPLGKTTLGNLNIFFCALCFCHHSLEPLFLEDACVAMSKGPEQVNFQGDLPSPWDAGT